ncbi:hypothetical protein [Veillonella magna]|uniref:Uncharacterized protein n=1 Tax=Veillonella magna TaxID=464322 RepID=A0ABS2GD20_9FIRM|nr:hypothetical protein [Veillonella magna]MBM6823378.1 hypothetical protein [Veillonella magna]MBM6911722.1 hypothetical protein [Veillonella magna]
MKNITSDKTNKVIITTKNSEQLAKKVKLLSAQILKRNQNLYKRLENR